jgi:D-alanyl-D-alanine carboxypeptidase/D-alanyl-D-alanine-endopeptidase (penicillin-binding protein 4)
MMRSIYFFLIFLWFCSCSPLSKPALTKRFNTIEKDLHDHTGFILYDQEKGKTIFEHNSASYFTPASNTKIFTLFASLKILGDSVPAIHYTENADSLIFWGTGDPSLFYKNVHTSSKVYDFLSKAGKPLYFSSSNFHTSSFGSGWSWDDYSDYYLAERSPFPVYGNLFTVKLQNDSAHVYPPYFKQFYSGGEQKERTQVIREIHSNDFKFHWGKRRSNTTEWNVPIRIDRDMIVNLLADTIKRKVIPITKKIPETTQTLHSIPVDSLYSEMMQESDNFIAEQLLLMCSDVLSDSLQTEITIDYVKKNFLADLSDEPSWVDGSGLSRYNLFTPRSIVQLWQKIYALRPRERLFPLLATGGVNGTVKNWYKADKPYLFGKTGSLSNVHCLSGFLVTRSGKTLIFSFMNNNFVAPTSKVRNNMQDLLKLIYERY